MKLWTNKSLKAQHTFVLSNLYPVTTKTNVCATSYFQKLPIGCSVKASEVRENNNEQTASWRPINTADRKKVLEKFKVGLGYKSIKYLTDLWRKGFWLNEVRIKMFH